jgi:hypothetical protein
MASHRDWQRYARKGTTKQRGYAGPHIALLKQRRAAWKPGDPCAHCGHGIMQLWRIMRDGRRICLADLPHNADRTGYLPGLAHAYCNRADGARRGNQMRGQHRGWPTSRRW